MKFSFFIFLFGFSVNCFGQQTPKIDHLLNCFDSLRNIINNRILIGPEQFVIIPFISNEQRFQFLLYSKNESFVITPPSQPTRIKVLNDYNNKNIDPNPNPAVHFFDLKTCLGTKKNNPDCTKWTYSYLSTEFLEGVTAEGNGNYSHTELPLKKAPINLVQQIILNSLIQDFQSTFGSKTLSILTHSEIQAFEKTLKICNRIDDGKIKTMLIRAERKIKQSKKNLAHELLKEKPLPSKRQSSQGVR